MPTLETTSQLSSDYRPKFQQLINDFKSRNNKKLYKTLEDENKAKIDFDDMYQSFLKKIWNKCENHEPILFEYWLIRWEYAYPLETNDSKFGIYCMARKNTWKRWEISEHVILRDWSNYIRIIQDKHSWKYSFESETPQEWAKFFEGNWIYETSYLEDKPYNEVKELLEKIENFLEKDFIYSEYRDWNSRLATIVDYDFYTNMKETQVQELTKYLLEYLMFDYLQKSKDGIFRHIPSTETQPIIEKLRKHKDFVKELFKRNILNKDFLLNLFNSYNYEIEKIEDEEKYWIPNPYQCKEINSDWIAFRLSDGLYYIHTQDPNMRTNMLNYFKALWFKN